MDKEFEDFNYKKAITDSTDILSARSVIQEYADKLGSKKTQLTVLATAASETYRLFIKMFEHVNTKICIEDTDSTGLKINISGTLNGNKKGKHFDPAEVLDDLNQKLKRVKIIFSQYELSVCTDTIVLTLVKNIPGDQNY